MSSVPVAAGFRTGMVNAVVPHARLEDFALDWEAEINTKSAQWQ